MLASYNQYTLLVQKHAYTIQQNYLYNGALFEKNEFMCNFL